MRKKKKRSMPKSSISSNCVVDTMITSSTRQINQRQSITALVYDKKNRLLSTGRNSYTKTHTVQARAARQVNQPSRIYLHAEIAALVKIKDWSKAHKIVILRYDKQSNPVNAAPCACCSWVIKQTNIKIIQHT